MEETSGAPQTVSSGRGAVPDHLRRYLVEQDHAAYEADAHTVWRDVLSRNRRLVREYGTRIHPAYVQGLRALQLPDRIPRVEEINERLAPTGWKIVAVDGYIPAAAYVGLMSASIFPVSRRIRRLEHIDFAPAPDMVHDILGHLPMLFSAEHREFLKELATITAQARPNALDGEFYDAVLRMADLRSDPNASLVDLAEVEDRVRLINRALVDHASELTCLRRMYVWSIEFGLLGKPDDFLVHGAALLSSPTEFRAVCAGNARILPYSLHVVREENAFSDVLGRYFVARDFAQMREVLTAYHDGVMRSAHDAGRQTHA